MALFVAAPAVQTSITNMSESGLIVLSVSAVVLAGFLLIRSCWQAARRARPARPRYLRGPARFREAFTWATGAAWPRTGTRPRSRSTRKRRPTPRRPATSEPYRRKGPP